MMLLLNHMHTGMSEATPLYSGIQWRMKLVGACYSWVSALYFLQFFKNIVSVSGKSSSL